MLPLNRLKGNSRYVHAAHKEPSTTAPCCLGPPRLLPVPLPSDLRVAHLLLQLENAVHERLRRRWAPGNIHVHRHDAVAPTRHGVAVVVIATTVGAAAHGDHP